MDSQGSSKHRDVLTDEDVLRILGSSPQSAPKPPGCDGPAQQGAQSSRSQSQSSCAPRSRQPLSMGRTRRPTFTTIQRLCPHSIVIWATSDFRRRQLATSANIALILGIMGLLPCVLFVSTPVLLFNLIRSTGTRVGVKKALLAIVSALVIDASLLTLFEVRATRASLGKLNDAVSAAEALPSLAITNNERSASLRFHLYKHASSELLKSKDRLSPRHTLPFERRLELIRPQVRDALRVGVRAQLDQVCDLALRQQWVGIQPILATLEEHVNGLVWLGDKNASSLTPMVAKLKEQARSATTVRIVVERLNDPRGAGGAGHVSKSDVLAHAWNGLRQCEFDVDTTDESDAGIAALTLFVTCDATIVGELVEHNSGAVYKRIRLNCSMDLQTLGSTIWSDAFSITDDSGIWRQTTITTHFSGNGPPSTAVNSQNSGEYASDKLLRRCDELAIPFVSGRLPAADVSLVVEGLRANAP